MSSRPRITLEALYRRDGGVCRICGHWGPIEDMDRDHHIPRSKGGGHARHNIRLAHIVCNNARADDHSDVTGWRRILLDLRERLTKG
jgi:5-methylcytosine-specific restriction endonuclease McrA